MNMEFLRKLNPRADFEHSGQEIVVADVKRLNLRAGRWEPAFLRRRSSPGRKRAACLPCHRRNVRGAFKVRGVSWNPDYIYDPKFAWKGVNVRHKLTIRPGPNNPVGLVWVDLTAPTYGIHGTPEPANIGKTESHGCIRLTNWDAVDLAAMVRPGTVVKFDDEDSPVANVLERRD